TDVVEAAQADAALEALADLRRIVLEPAQRLDREVVAHDHAVARQARLRVPLDEAVADDRARDVAPLGGAEDLADLRRAHVGLLELRLEHALERALDVVDRVVDHRVVAHVDALGLGQIARLGLRPHVEAYDDRVVDRREVDVVLRDRTDAAVDDAEVDLVAHVDLE